MTGPTSNSPMVPPTWKGYSPSRTAKVRHLIHAIGKQPLTRAQTAELLGTSIQNAGKYLVNLVTCGILDQSPVDIGKSLNRRPYRIVSPEIASEFLLFIDRPNDRPRTRKVANIEIEPHRHIHLIYQDSAADIKPVEVSPDPLALPRQFFVLAAREALQEDAYEPAPRVAPAPSPGFPDPAHYRLDLSPEVRS